MEAGFALIARKPQVLKTALRGALTGSNQSKGPSVAGPIKLFPQKDIRRWLAPKSGPIGLKAPQAGAKEGFLQKKAIKILN